MNKEWTKTPLTDFNYFPRTYSVLDFETTIRNVEGNNPVGSMPGSPFHPKNVIHLTGWTTPKTVRSLAADSFHTRPHFYEHLHPAAFIDSLEEMDMLVGQNFKFDLLYLMMHHYDDIMGFFRRGGVIWDTMQAEYLLTNQTEKFAALGNKYKIEEITGPSGSVEDERTLIKQGMAEKYGGTDKDDRIKEFWDKGVDTPDIPHDMLTEYCYNDVRNTAIVFREQLRLAHDKGQAFVNLLSTQMQAIVSTSMMEYNGMKFNIDTAHAASQVLIKQCDKLQEWCENRMHDEFELFNTTGYSIPRDNMNANSTKQLSALLYGGEYAWAAPVHQVDADGKQIFIKSGPNKGKAKTKLESVSCTVIPECGEEIAEGMKSQLDSTSLGWSTDEDAIKRVVIPTYEGMSGSANTIVFVKKLLEFRSVYKDVYTYYISLMELMWGTDGCIHGNLNHCVAATGRLTSSAPNMQNVSGGDE